MRFVCRCLIAAARLPFSLLCTPEATGALAAAQHIFATVRDARLIGAAAAGTATTAAAAAMSQLVAVIVGGLQPYAPLFSPVAVYCLYVLIIGVWESGSMVRQQRTRLLVRR